VAAADAARPERAVRQPLGAVRPQAVHPPAAHPQLARLVVAAVVNAELEALLRYRLFLRTGFRSRLSATPDKE
jgi:hypothetical protein